MPEPRDLLSAYREMLSGLRRGAGPAGALFSPLEMTAELLEQLLSRQQDLEAQLNTTLQPLRAMYGLARDAPAALRTQARAFEAASASFDQAAQVMNRQADLLERTVAALDTPAGLLRSVRPPGKDAPPKK
jgi:methyl-accepting chemotaxis protein